MACAVRSIIEKWDLIKLQSFFRAKDTVNMTKKATNRLGKNFTNPKSDRRLLSNIHKQLKMLNSRISNNPIKKWCSELNKKFSTGEYRRAEK
jgi:hypothetical protein